GDKISDVFGQQIWAFHTMMIIYLFFTVILVLNILIDNHDNTLSLFEFDTTWELIWLQNRLWHIESVENMLHYILD
ncbi:hypothetical protein BGZ50_005733, partial [Haplosporangium sp. Z 11]